MIRSVRSTRAVALTGVLLLAGLAITLLVILASFQPYLLLIPVGAIAAFKVWERPALGVVGVTILVAVPWSTGGEGQALAHVTAADLASAVLVGVVAVRTLIEGDEGRLRSWVILPLVGIILAGCVVTITAYEPLDSLFGLIRYAQVFAIVPVATYLAIRSRSDLKLILGTMIALAIFEGVIGVYQFLTATGAGYGEIGTIRAIGTFSAFEVNAVGNITSAAIVISIALFAGLRSVTRWWGLLLAILLSFPMAFSLSRGAWLSATVGLIVILALAGSQRRLGSQRSLVLFALSGILIITTTLVALGGSSGIVEYGSGVITDRFISILDAPTASADYSVQSRYALWEASGDMWASHPITGVGLKNFPYFRDTYLGLESWDLTHLSDSSRGIRDAELLSPHNTYFLILAEQGLLGILAYGTLVLSLGIAGLRRLRDVKEFSTEKVFGLAILGFLASYLTFSIYGDPGGSVTILYSIFLGGLIWLASGMKLEEGKPDESSRSD